jgi:hypothetical protein
VLGHDVALGAGRHSRQAVTRQPLGRRSAEEKVASFLIGWRDPSRAEALAMTREPGEFSFQFLISVKERWPLAANILSQWRNDEMPVDAMMLSFAVSAVLIAFAVVLAWGNSQTRTRKADVPATRRRSF